MLPNNFARRRIGADDLLTLVGSLWLVVRNRIELAPENDWSRTSAELLLLPQHVAARSAIGVPAFNEALFSGDSILLRPTPVRPIHRIGCRRDAGACKS